MLGVNTPLRVNGQERPLVGGSPDTPLLWVLRAVLGLTATKFGCGVAACGACTVQLDGTPVRSCQLPLSAVNGKIKTLEGLGTAEKPHPLQLAYIKEQVPQCGQCINGWMMTAAELLEKNKNPTDAQIKDALTGIKCRCATHMGIMRAVKTAAAMMK